MAPYPVMIGLTLLLTALASGRAFSHGEDLPGPNGGVIRMPGAYHLELVPVDAGRVRFYVLDMEWKNPVVANTHLRADVTRGTVTIPLRCEVEEKAYLCATPKGERFRRGDTLVVESRRERAKGVAVKYPFPFRNAAHSKKVNQ